MAKKKNSLQKWYGKVPTKYKLIALSAASMAAGAYGGPAGASAASYLLKLVGTYLAG